MDTARESIIDDSKPNAGRIYDYILGGDHNFEVDRRAAEHLKHLVPFGPKMARLQRWCLQDLAIELTTQRGFDVIIDFASGLPTEDHIHCKVPPGTVVIYSDYDPVVVEYALEILGNTPNVYYFHADARRPEELLTRPQVEAILGGRRDVALAYWGGGSFLTDEEISHAARVLYEWSGPKSSWAFNSQAADVDAQDASYQQVLQIYEQMGAVTYPRSQQRYEQLLHPWRIDDKGFVALLEWHGFDLAEMSEQDLKLWGPSGGGYGAYLIK